MKQRAISSVGVVLIAIVPALLGSPVDSIVVALIALGALYELSGDPLLDERQRIVYLQRLLQRRLRHESPPVALDRYEPLVGNPDQRLTNHYAATAEYLGQVALSKFCPRQKSVGEDGADDGRRNVSRSVAHVEQVPLGPPHSPSET